MMAIMIVSRAVSGWRKILKRIVNGILIKPMNTYLYIVWYLHIKRDMNFQSKQQ